MVNGAVEIREYVRGVGYFREEGVQGTTIMALYAAVNDCTTMLMVAVQSKARCPISKDVTKQVRCNMLRSIQKHR